MTEQRQLGAMTYVVAEMLFAFSNVIEADEFVAKHMATPQAKVKSIRYGSNRFDSLPISRIDLVSMSNAERTRTGQQRRSMGETEKRSRAVPLSADPPPDDPFTPKAVPEHLRNHKKKPFPAHLPAHLNSKHPVSNPDDLPKDAA